MELGSHIKTRRAELGISQDELAGRIYVSRQTISSWENDKTYPDVQSLLLVISYILPEIPGLGLYVFMYRDTFHDAPDKAGIGNYPLPSPDFSDRPHFPIRNMVECMYYIRDSCLPYEP